MNSAEQFDDEEREWDQFVASNSHGYHEQTSGYGRIRSQYGYVCQRVVVRRAGEIVGGAQILVQRTPVGKYARIFRAPLVRDDDSGVLRETVCALEAHAEREGYASLRVDLFPTQQPVIDELARAGFRSSPAWFGQLSSASVDLSKSEQEIHQAMSRDSRRCIRIARQSGIQVRCNEQTSIEDFFAVRELTARHASYTIYPLWYYRYIWQFFGATGKAVLHTAYYQGEPAGALVNMNVGNRMYFVWMGTNRDDAVKKAMGNYLLYQEAIGQAKRVGCSHCDCMGRRPFTAKLMPEEIVWPEPMRKCYGVGRTARRQLIDWTWSVPKLRHGVDRLAKRWGLRPKMPY